MSVFSYLGFVIAILIITTISVYYGLHDNTNGEKHYSSAMTTGFLLGTMIGGNTTIGTTQLAYSYGMSAWWYTLSCSISLILMGLFFYKPYRKFSNKTIVGVVEQEYGKASGMIASILNTIGGVVSLAAQLVSGSAVILVIFPNLSSILAEVLVALLITIYIVIGGTKGASKSGIIKLFLVTASLALSAAIIISKLGGLSNFNETFKSLELESGIRYGYIFGRGLKEDSGLIITSILGSLSAESYAIAFRNAKDDHTAKHASFISAAIVPFVGLFAIAVGVYMRTVTDASTFIPKTALTKFILDYSGIPALISGIILGTLLIVSIGAGSGSILGTANIFNKDVLQKFTNKHISDHANERLTNIIMVVIMLLCLVFLCCPIGDTILSISVIAMAFRATTLFAPMLFATIVPCKVNKRFATLAIAISPCVYLYLKLSPFIPTFLVNIDPFIPAIIISFIIMTIGYLLNKHNIQ